MDAASPVRREFVAQMLAARKAPKGVGRLVAQMLTTHCEVLESWSKRGRPMLDELMYPGKARRPGTAYVPAKATEERCRTIMLTAIAAAIESRITKTTWRTVEPAVALWLEFCETNGFALDPVEKIIIEKAGPAGRPRPGTPPLSTTVSQIAAGPDITATDTDPVNDLAFGEEEPPEPIDTGDELAQLAALVSAPGPTDESDDDDFDASIPVAA